MGEVKLVLSGPFESNFATVNLDSPSNTAIESGCNRLILGFSGFTRVMPRAARKVSAALPTVLRFPGARIATQIFSNTLGTGCKMGRSENGSLS